MKIKKKKKAAKSAVKQDAPAPQKSRQYKATEDVLEPDMIAFHYWREWFRARERNDWPFMYEMSGQDSPLRAQLGEREQFAERCRRRDHGVPGLRDGDLRKIRLDGPDVAQMFRVVGLSDRMRQEVLIERWCMLRGPDGWNMIAVDEVTRGRQETLDAIQTDWFASFEAPAGFVGRSEIPTDDDASTDDSKDAADATGDADLVRNDGASQ